MNRRLRSPNGKPSTLKIREKYHRFLRPGALARIRDFKISARSPRSGLKIAIPYRLSPPSSPVPAHRATDEVDLSPCFAVRNYGPRFPQRKKLVAAKLISFMPSSPSGIEVPNSAADFFNADLLVAH